MSSFRRLYLRAWGHRQLTDRIMIVVLAAVVVIGGVLIATSDNSSKSKTTTDTADTTTSTGKPKPCSKEKISGDTRITCQAKTSTLSIAGQNIPILLSGTQARVFRASLDGENLTARMRVRNETSSPRALLARSRQFYLSTNGKRVFPSALTPETTLGPHKASTAVVTFPLGASLRRQLARSKTVDLGVVPFDQIGSDQPSQLGVIKLQITGV